MGRERRAFGAMRKLPSGRYQASYTGPDTRRYNAPMTFQSKLDAEAWLTDVRRALERDEWAPDWGKRASANTTFGGYAEAWLKHQTTLKPRTREHYGKLLARLILPTFGSTPLKQITPALVRAWHAEMGEDTPTQRAHAYSLLRNILGQAVRDREIDTNPCHLRGAGNSKRRHKIETATPEQLAALLEALPSKYRAMVLLATWCGLRWGELIELRRKDIRLDLPLGHGVVTVRRAVVRTGGQFVVGTPKSDAGIRDVAIPPHLLPPIDDHLHRYVAPAPNDLLFPASEAGRHLATSTFVRSWYPAREAAGRPDLRFHDLRHTGAVLAATAGATIAELMARLGHSTAGAAMRYQHAAQDRDRLLASKLSELNSPRF